MTLALRIILPIYLFLPTYEASIIDDFMKEMYDEQNLAQNIFVRLTKRSWKPSGPSSKTEEVMDEYKWNVQTALETLTSSQWDYEVTHVDEVEKLFKSENYDKTLDTIVIIHPVVGSKYVDFMKTTAIALGMRNLHKKYNIFAIDMSKNKWVIKLSLVQLIAGYGPRFAPMARAMSRFLVRGIAGQHLKPEQIHLLGWSYAAQIVGYMGRYIEQKYDSQISTITALEPIANLLNNDYLHVSELDARVVHVYHTNSYLIGSRERIGTADFVFNSGRVQPECQHEKEPNLCSHLKVVDRLWYLILYPSKFVGRKCPTWNSLVNCYCETEPTLTLAWPIKPDSKAEGIHHLRTLDAEPYGLGQWGLSCSSERVLHQQFNRMESFQP